MITARLVEDNSLRVTENGYELRIRFFWYRSLPLSSVEKVLLTLDGEPVDPSAISFGINDHEYQLDELHDLYEEIWFVQDSALLNVHQPGKVTIGETHTIGLELSMRSPYIELAPGEFLVDTTKYTTTQIAS
jgi:hypothetical protein